MVPMAWRAKTMLLLPSMHDSACGNDSLAQLFVHYYTVFAHFALREPYIQTPTWELDRLLLDTSDNDRHICPRCCTTYWSMLIKVPRIPVYSPQIGPIGQFMLLDELD